MNLDKCQLSFCCIIIKSRNLLDNYFVILLLQTTIIVVFKKWNSFEIYTYFQSPYA